MSLRKEAVQEISDENCKTYQQLLLNQKVSEPSCVFIKKCVGKSCALVETQDFQSPVHVGVSTMDDINTDLFWDVQ